MPRAVRGMTLVELLVVIAILGLLSVAVIPVVDGGSLRPARAAVASLTSLVATAQAQALGRDNPVGLWIEPLDAGAAIDVAIARQPEPYRGDTFDAAVSLAGSVASGTMVLTFSDAGNSVTTLTAPSDPPFVTTGDGIEFEGSPDRFTLVCPDPPGRGGYRAAVRPEAGQTPSNTRWPAPAVAGSGTAWHAFAIIRRPRPVAEGMSFGSGLAIDLAWSGVGTRRFGRTPLAGDGASSADASDDLEPLPAYGAGQAIAIMFDRVGGVGELGFFNTPRSIAAGRAAAPPETRVPLRAPVFLLVGRIDRCGMGYREAPTEDAPGANWQYPDSFWVSIDPRTGLARSSPVVLRDRGGPVTSARRSQAAIRAAS
ncbi:MAG: Tfp pilus assembly protein FimT/FimU [Planctomycetaceae bacterium]